MTDQWTPWRSHTPGPCPVPAGTWVQLEEYCRITKKNRIKEGRITSALVNHEQWWTDGSGYWARIIRIRSRIPPGMQLLNEALKVKEVEHV